MMGEQLLSVQLNANDLTILELNHSFGLQYQVLLRIIGRFARHFSDMPVEKIHHLGRDDGGFHGVMLLHGSESIHGAVDINIVLFLGSDSGHLMTSHWRSNAAAARERIAWRSVLAFHIGSMSFIFRLPSEALMDGLKGGIFVKLCSGCFASPARTTAMVWKECLICRTTIPVS